MSAARGIGRVWPWTDRFVPPEVSARGGVELMRARMLVLFCWLFVLTAMVAIVPRLTQPEAARWEIVSFVLYAVLAALAPWALRRTGQTRALGIFVTFTGLTSAFSGAWAMEGIFSASVVWFATLPLLSAFLLGSGTAWVSVAVSSSVFVVMGAMHAAGLHTLAPMASLVHRVVNLTGLTVFIATIARLHEWSTEQARVSEHEALALFQALSRRVGVGTVLVERGVVRAANGTAEALLEVSPAEIHGKQWSEIEADHGPTADGAQVREITRGASGAERRIEVRVEPVDGVGHPTALVTLLDVTPRWRLEEAERAVQAEVSRSLHEKETLLKEIHHRVKNNLQIISSMLALQSEQMPDEVGRTHLRECVLRVRSMALIHQQLYGMDSLARVDFGEYARTLSQSLCNAMAPSLRVQVRSEKVELPVDVSVPLGLVLNELVTNAIKYGQPPPGARPRVGRAGADCDLLVEVSTDGERVSLAVSDSGPGLPHGVKLTQATGLGMQLVRSLVRQLRGRVVADSHDGTRFEVNCPRVMPLVGSSGGGLSLPPKTNSVMPR